MKPIDHHLELFKTYTNLLTKEAEQLASMASAGVCDGAVREWIPATNPPESDSELVVIKTDSGAKMFGSTIGGKFMKNVVAWYALPKD